MKNNRITIRYDSEEYQTLITLAHSTGLPVSEYVRKTSLHRHITVAHPPINIETYRALLKIAESLKKLESEVQRATSQGQVIPNLSCEVINDLYKVVRQIRKEIAINQR